MTDSECSFTGQANWSTERSPVVLSEGRLRTSTSLVGTLIWDADTKTGPRSAVSAARALATRAAGRPRGRTGHPPDALYQRTLVAGKDTCDDGPERWP